MSEFTIRSESVDVDQIMKQIRQRILEKRGADYTEDQVRELASVRLEKFLDPKNLRSDLLEQFRKSRPAIAMPRVDPPAIEAPYTFDDQTLFASHRGPMRLVRKVLRPLLKLFFNPNTLNQILHTQAQFNVDLLKREARRKIEFGERLHQFDQSRAEWNMLYYEVLHNIVLETTRMGIEVQNLRMKVESLSSRLDFSERRVRALEGVVQYRPEAIHAPERGHDDDEAPIAAPAGGASGEGYVPTGGPASSGQGQGQGDGTRRKRRRRRGRRGGGEAGGAGAPGAAGPSGTPGATTAGGAGDTAPGAGPDEGDDFEGDDDFDQPGEREAQAPGALEAPEPNDAPEAHNAPDAAATPDAPAAPADPSDDNGRQ